MSIVTEVCFVVEGKDYKVRSDKLVRTSEYYAELLDSSKDFSELRLLLPDWITVRPFQVYLSYIENSRLSKVDLIMAQKILWIADFFKDESLQTSLISQQIIPFLNKETVLLFVQDSCTKIHTNEGVIEAWTKLYQTSCEYSSKHLKYLFEKFGSAIAKLDPNAIANIFELAISTENPVFIHEKLSELRGKESVNELISELVEESLQEFQREIPKFLVFEWEISDFEFGNFYKESEPFEIGNCNWVLSVCCFEHEKKLEISIKQCDVEKAFRHKIVAITSLVQVKDEIIEDLSPKVKVIPSYSQNPNVIRILNSFTSENIENFSIKFYAKCENVLSSILVNVAQSPSIMLSEKVVGNIPKDIFLVLMSLNYLNVQSEDLVLELIANWCEWNQSIIDPTDIETLISCIRWDYLNVKAIVHTLTHYSVLQQFESFKVQCKAELENKAKKFHSDNTEARKSYKKTVKKETFPNYKEYLNSVFDILFDLDVKKNEPKDEVNDLRLKLENTEKEIQILRNGGIEILSPILNNKEDELNLNLTPVRNHFKSRNSSMDTFINRSADVSMRIKSRRAGLAIGDLVSKLRSSRKGYGYK